MITKKVEIVVSQNKKMVLDFNKDGDIWVCKITNNAMNEIENYRGDNIKVKVDE